MNLRDLDARFLRMSDKGLRKAATLSEAQGVVFLCPQCFTKNKGKVGTHSVVCWFRGRGVPDDLSPGPGRWDATGTSIDNLTLNPSVSLPDPGCGWHGWVREGDAA